LLAVKAHFHLRYNDQFPGTNQMATSKSNAPDKKLRKPRSGEKPLAAAPQPAAAHNGSPSSKDILRNLYAWLLKCRLTQEYVQQLSGPKFIAAGYDLAIGHEAVPVGATADRRAEVTVTASPRNLAALVAAGAALPDLLAHRDDHRHCVCTAQGSSSLFLSEDPLNMGTGLAHGYKLQKLQQVVVALCRREAPLDNWHEAWKFAGAHKLPIVYVIDGENRAESDDSHLEAISFMARDCGFPGVVVDGRDVVAVWRVAQESIHRARIGSGATLIDCRSETAHDPLAHLEHYMRKRRFWGDAWSRQLAARISAALKV
jgi:pyruvate dehydrogenase E1 component alpha subunit